jgi:transposase
MKKISTVAVRQNRNISEQKLTIGFDLGDRSSWYCVLDEAGSVLLELRSEHDSEGDEGSVRKHGTLPHRTETGMHSPWVSRLLGELGHEVIVAHARSVRLIGESRKKDDRRDAQRLARCAARIGERPVPSRHAGYGDSANPPTCEREYNGNVLHQDCRR